MSCMAILRTMLMRLGRPSMMILMQMRRGIWILMRMATWRWALRGLLRHLGIRMCIPMGTQAAVVLGSQQVLRTWILRQGGTLYSSFLSDNRTMLISVVQNIIHRIFCALPLPHHLREGRRNDNRISGQLLERGYADRQARRFRRPGSDEISFFSCESWFAQSSGQSCTPSWITTSQRLSQIQVPTSIILPSFFFLLSTLSRSLTVLSSLWFRFAVSFLVLGFGVNMVSLSFTQCI